MPAPARRLRSLLFPLAFLVLGGGLASGEPEPAPASRETVVPVAMPIQLDGAMTDAEWEGAAEIPVDDEGTVLRISQFRGTFLLGIRSQTAWRPRSRLWLMFVADDDAAGLYQDGALRLDFEPLEHNRAHLLVMKQKGPVEVPLADAAVARAVLLPTSFSVEVGIPLETLGLEPGTEQAVRFALLWARMPPQKSRTWPQGLRTDAPVGQPPPDLASSKGWARLVGWQDVGGPGALSRSDWQALLDHANELTRRGRDAHAFGYRIDEERATRKVDREQVPLLEENLHWIAKHEPLSPNDLVLLARGYRFLNRNDEALAVLAALDADPAWRGTDLLLYQRALTLESAERFGEAAAAWTALGSRGTKASRDRYLAMAERARENEKALAAEHAARRALEAEGYPPLVLLRTARGNVVIQLHGDVPNAMAHFMDLALGHRQEDGRGFYAGTLFHRVIGDYVVQGGDPLSRDVSCDEAGPSEGPTTVTTEISERHGYWRGAVCFARGIAQVNGCQFFILVSPRPALAEEGYTVFGHVVSGMDVVDRIELCDELIEVRMLQRPIIPDLTPPPEDEE